MSNLQKVQAKDSAMGEVVLEGRAKGGLYEMPISLKHAGASLSCTTQSHSLWHLHLGHLNSSYMDVLINQGLINLLPNLCNCVNLVRSENPMPSLIPPGKRLTPPSH